jgi:hypothetical protein
MIEQIVRSGTPILFDYDAFARWNIPASIGQGADAALQGGSNSTDNDANVEASDAGDAVQPITDELWKMPLWWILEILPMTYTYQNAQDKWVKTFG